MILRTGVIVVVLLAASAWFVPGPRAALDRVRFPRRTFGVERSSWDYSLDSHRGILSAQGRTMPFRLPDQALDVLYDEAIASRLFDAGPLRRIQERTTVVLGAQTGVGVRSGPHAHTFVWTSRDWGMRDLHDDTGSRIQHFSAQIDSIVRAQPAFRELPTPRFRPM